MNYRGVIFEHIPIYTRKEKSRTMKNFIFKSEADFHKIVFNKLDMLLAEQRHQRSDLSILISKMTVIYNALALQKQVDEYFDEDKENIPEVKDDSNSSGN